MLVSICWKTFSSFLTCGASTVAFVACSTLLGTSSDCLSSLFCSSFFNCEILLDFRFDYGFCGELDVSFAGVAVSRCCGFLLILMSCGVGFGPPWLFPILHVFQNFARIVQTFQFTSREQQNIF